MIHLKDIFHSLTSAAVKVKFTEKQQEGFLPDILSIADIRYSNYDNTIRLTGIKKSEERVFSTSDSYNYQDNSLLNLDIKAEFDESPELLNDALGIQLYTNENLILTRTKNSVIVNPNNSIIKIEDTDTEIEKDLKVSGTLDIKGNTKIHNSIDVLKNINIAGNINLGNNLDVGEKITANKLCISTLQNNSIPYSNYGELKHSNNFKWNESRKDWKLTHLKMT